jgi:C1A family cysteine protease
MQIFGLASASDYKYQNMKQNVCQRSRHPKLLHPQFIVRQMEVEPKGDEEAMKKLIMRIGVAVVATHADEAFLSITKGSYENESCAKNEPNHAMVVCGFGGTPGNEYWLIRNSWGSSWGEYVRTLESNQNDVNNCDNF